MTDTQAESSSIQDGDSDNPDTGEGEITPVRLSLPLPVRWLDLDAAKVIRRLQYWDYKAYLVGGSVRDLMVGRYPKDFDIATSARPREVKRAFTNCRLIGRRFRLAHILFRDSIVEVATFRRDPNAGMDDGEAEGGSKPKKKGSKKEEDLLIRDDNVFGNAADDAFRRDFTINALYYDLATREVLDYVGGLEDIESREVRTIGNPGRRFQEDPIRMLRAVKFASRLGFSIEEETWDAMVKHAPDLLKAAVPRIQEEIFRMLRSGVSQSALFMLAESGLLDYILPDHCAMLLDELDAIDDEDGSLEEVDDDASQTEDDDVESLDEGSASEDENSEDENSEDENSEDENSEDDNSQYDDDFSEDDSGGNLRQGSEKAATTRRGGDRSQDEHAALPELPPFSAYLDALDHLQEPIGSHHYLGVLGLHPAMSAIDLDLDRGPRPQEQFVEIAAAYFDELGASLRISRRDREQARLSYMGFARLLFRPEHRRTLQTLSKKSYFPESVALFGLHVLATDGEHLELFHRSLSKLRYRGSVGPVLDAVTRRFGPPPKDIKLPAEGENHNRSRPRPRPRSRNRRRRR